MARITAPVVRVTVCILACDANRWAGHPELGEGGKDQGVSGRLGPQRHVHTHVCHEQVTALASFPRDSSPHESPALGTSRR